MEAIHKIECKKCGYTWFPKSTNLPKVCPRCKSFKWTQERVRGNSK